MSDKTKKLRKEWASLAWLAVQVVVTVLGFIQNWDLVYLIGLMVANILLLFYVLNSVSAKFETETIEGNISDKLEIECAKLRVASEEEHNEIKGIIDLWKDVKGEEHIAHFEGNFFRTHENDIEIWVISNTVREPPCIIEGIYKNLRHGTSYYYIIPSGTGEGSCEADLMHSMENLRLQGPEANEMYIEYVHDDLFDLMPTDVVDIVFYCNPCSTDYKDKMHIYYCFQDYKDSKYYKPAKLSETEIKNYSTMMTKWKNEKKWERLPKI